MASYTPPYNITNGMLTLVSSISEKVGKISVTSNMQAKPHLRKNNRIKSIHSSLRIEASESDSAEKLSDFTKAEIPYPIASLKSKTPRFSQVIDKEDMADAVLLFADKQ